MRINHNPAALAAANNLSKLSKKLDKNINKVSSGKRINTAADDSAGLAISEGMKAQARGLKMANRNIEDGISLLQTAEGGLNETHALLQRMRTLALQGSNGIFTPEDRAKLQTEIEQIKKEIDRIALNTEFNGIKVLNAGTERTTQISANQVSVYVRPGERVIAGYIDVPNPPNPTTLTVQGEFGTISGAEWPDMNILSPTNEWFGYQEANLSSSTYIEDTDNTSSTKATYNGWSIDIEQMNFENPVAGRWTVEIRNYGTTGSTFNISSNYPIVLNSAPTNITSTNPNALKLQAGANKDQNLLIDLTDATADKIGVSTVSVISSDAANAALQKIDDAINLIAEDRARFGAYQNRLESISNFTLNYAENLTSSESKLSDVDIAEEVCTLTKHQVLLQSSQSMLTQANTVASSILALFR